MFDKKVCKDKMYLASCDVLDMNSVSKIRVGEMLFKNKKEAEKWMKYIHENYLKDDLGNISKNWKVVDYLCYEADGCEYYVVEYKEGTRWTRHELKYRPITFAEKY